MFPRLKNREVNLCATIRRYLSKAIDNILVLESQIVAGKTPTNVVRVPMVLVWQDAPHDRIIHTVC